MMHFINKPYSPACDRNGAPILEALQLHFADRQRVLEIGSGSGQHAVRFAAALPHLTWQASDREDYLPGIRMWLDEANLPNTPPPLPLDVRGPWPDSKFDALFSANTLHIMSWEEVRLFFERLALILSVDARLCIYGPFRYAGQPFSPGNTEFDAALRAEDPRRGIRDFEAVNALAIQQGFQLMEDRAMPANNRCLSWYRCG